MVILLQCLKICDFVHRNQLVVSMSDIFTWSHHDWENTLLSVFHTKISLKRRWLDSQNWVLNHWHESWCALMTWTSNDDDLTSDDRESNWWLLVNWWVRMMTSKSDGHISPEWCPWVMSRTLGEMMKTCRKRWLQNALISCCFRKMRAKLCKQKESAAQIFWSLFEQTFLQQRNFFIASLYANTWIKIVRVYSTN